MSASQNLNIRRFTSMAAGLWLCPFYSLMSMFSCLWYSKCLYFVTEQSQAERSNSIAVAGAVMGAVLALFLIAVFIIVILTARKAPPPAFTDKV